MIEWNKIEKKWQEKWNSQKHHNAEPDSREKKFITVAYPYPNSPQHIGHGRTYTLADVHARYYRMRGYNVLFPMAFHYTGTPILAMAKRIEQGDSEITGVLYDIYKVPKKDMETFSDPVKIADYFHAEIKSGMQEIGYSIDWRREFTTIDPAYKKFIEWQIGTLRSKNLIIQGSHPVGWCPKDENPVSQHDTLGDVEPDFTEYVMVKFESDGYIIPTATLRPETLFGVTNLWVNPDIIYKKITVDGKKWIVSSECAHKLEFLDKNITYEGNISGKDLAGKMAKMPHADTLVPMLAASFVESQTGTGIVMSVPAHAPFDWQALSDLKESGDAQAAGIEPVSIITTPGYGKYPAQEACQKFGIKNQDDAKLEEATAEIYSKEFYGGVLNENTAKFAKSKVEEAKESVKEWLLKEKHSDILLELTNAPVRCRCGAECVVKILSNQWFLNYGDANWKKDAVRCLENMSILPPEIRVEFVRVVDWLRERACARQHGLGTNLPWDKNWIVESLSDSVIYMAYYILSKHVNSGAIKPECLLPEFFDYVFLDKGDAKTVSEATQIPEGIIQEIRDEFAYFYPVDSRHSGRDLVPNHLTFFVLNHVAIFPESLWPKEIVVNGSMLMDGKKMSKSMGNIIPLRQAIRDHGADPIRLGIIMAAELLQDADFGLESVAGIKSKIESMYAECHKVESESGSIQAEDLWIKDRLRDMASDVAVSIEKMRLREALHLVLFAFESDLSWYKRRAAAKNRTDTSGILHEIHCARVSMLSPFAPHVAEEMWEMLGGSEMVSRSKWPEISGESDFAAVQSEELLKKTMADIAKIAKMSKITPKKITVYAADKFKGTIYHTILNSVMEGNADMREIMKGLLSGEHSARVKKDPGYVQKTIKDVLSEPAHIRAARQKTGSYDEKKLYTDELAGLVSSEYGIKLQVFSESDSEIYDPKGKARHSRPFKPAIFIE